MVNYTVKNYTVKNYTVKNYTVYMCALLLYFIISYMVIDYRSCKGKHDLHSVLTKVILYWMVLGIFIGLFELVLFFKSDYISSLPLPSIKQNFWYNDIPLHSILTPNFWSKGWREYGDFCDTRYIKPTNMVHYIELIHAITAFVYIYILYYFFRYNTINTSFIGKLMVSISIIHLLGTIIYFITFYSYLNKKPIKKGLKFWSYLLLNILWLILPTLVLVKGISIVHKNYYKPT